MSGRGDLIKTGALIVCAGALILICMQSALGIQVPKTDYIILAVATIVLCGLYLYCYYATYRKLVTLENSAEASQKREQLSLQVVESLTRAIDARDQKGRGRAERVREMALAIAQELSVPEAELDAIRIAALLADIGKLAVPDYVLYKPGPLTDEEFRKVKTHATVGASIIANIPFSGSVIPIVRGHHECYDGNGYPDGLEGAHIPLGARILAVADVYCALLSDRPHRAAYTAKQARKIIEQGSGNKFDPEVVTACFKVLSRTQNPEHISFMFDADDKNPPPHSEDISEDQQDAYAHIAKAQNELLGLYEIVQTAATGLTIQNTLELLTGKLRNILSFASGVIFLVDHASQNLRVGATCGMLASSLRNKSLAWGSGISGEVAASGQPSHLNVAAQSDLALLLGKDHRDIRELINALAVPFFDEFGEVAGVISLYQKAEAPFGEDDLRLLTAVAVQASSAVAKARAYEATEKTALTDPLTELPNARFFFVELEREMSRARRENQPLSLLMLDIDHFKQINDTFGHQQGDRILQELAGILRAAIRQHDIIARYGGDEFFLLLPNTSNRQALDSMLRLKEAVASHNPDLGNLRVRISVGVATFPGGANDTKSLLAAADKSMYTDKDLNHKQVVLAREIADQKEAAVASAGDQQVETSLRSKALQSE
jgi:diguanylate cyclase (GGDEF)-like protein